MCDYSLHLVASRPAKVGDKLVSTSFPHTTTRGFASVDDRNVAVCLLPGTELAFEEEVRCDTGMVFSWRLGHTVAKFRQVDKNRSNVYHDALEFPDGKIVLLTHLCKGQLATVLQLPARAGVTANDAQPHNSLAVVDWHCPGQLARLNFAALSMAICRRAIVRPACEGEAWPTYQYRCEQREITVRCEPKTISEHRGG